MITVITKSVGEDPAANEPGDVRKVQALLKHALPGKLVHVTGTCDKETVAAIREFQSIWIVRPDCRVDPRGATLKRLNEVTTPLRLNRIRLGRIKYGGYLLSYSGVVPPKLYSLHLRILPASDSLDVTTRDKNDVMGADNLPNLLEIIGKNKLWGTPVRCQLILKQNALTVTESNIESFDAPVQPYAGTLKPGLGCPDGGPTLSYTGIATGRMLYQPAIGGKYFFSFGGKFETSNAQRGLNCITYVGAVFGVDPASGALGSYGTQLADHINATQCDMENKKEAEIKDFFKVEDTGTYIMWSSSHVVLVVDGTVHEFCESKNGYSKTPVEDWNFHGKSYWIRKCAKSFLSEP